MFSFIIFLVSLFPQWIEAEISLGSIVIQTEGNCHALAERIAQEQGYRYVRQIFDGYCELEEDSSSENHQRYRRMTERSLNPVESFRNHSHVKWAELQIPRKRVKRELEWNDPEWKNMWHLMRHVQTPNLPDLNVTGAWQMGYTGRGIVVAVVDDGLEVDHPDLEENYDQEASTDINDNDDNPMPRYEPANENKHGTRCAGEIAATANNRICGVGIAYDAGIGGIRMLDGKVTDSVEARALSHRSNHIDIYSASWGPDDDGMTVDGPYTLTKKALENGVRNGRGGKGSIFVWASGNGGADFDSCACDGYINSIYTIVISSTTERGTKPWYAEECSGIFATTYSSGGKDNSNQKIITTDLNHTCTSNHTGTSAAAPLAAGIYALVLEANSQLTWRDVMHITVLGSRPHAIPSNTKLIRNAAGFYVSSRYGFGLMDAGLMTWYASDWKNVPAMLTCKTSINRPREPIPSNSKKIFRIHLTAYNNSLVPKCQVNFIEQVQVLIDLTATIRGEIQIYLYSPSYTRTQILSSRANDLSDEGFTRWSFLTVQLWGENPHGLWQLRVCNKGEETAVLMSWQLVVYGTGPHPVPPRRSSNVN